MGGLTYNRKRRSADCHLPIPLPQFLPETPPPWKRLKQPPPPPTSARASASASAPPLPSSPAESSPATFPARYYPCTAPPRHFHCPQRIVRAFGIGSAGLRGSRLAQHSSSLESDAEARTSGSRPTQTEKNAFFVVRQMEVAGDGLGLVRYNDLVKSMGKESWMTSRVNIQSSLAAVSGITPKADSFFSPRMEEVRTGLGLERYMELVSSVNEGYLMTPHIKAWLPPLAVSNGTQKAEAASNFVVVRGQEMKDDRTVAAGPSLENESGALTNKVPLYKELLEHSKKHDAKLKSLQFELSLEEKRAASSHRLRENFEVKPKQESDAPFIPLTQLEEDEVNHALNGRNRREVLAIHEASNIEITREVLQCLRYGAWLNDEVINLYLELLKERERREPKKFLKCHFFNTFFYKKLINGSNGYDFKSVRRWTTQKKIGYGLIECEKIFVPVHKEVHWCLAVINVRDKKFQYLDSLGGMDSTVLKVLARYFMDEVRDKSGKQVDTLSWKQEGVHDLPLQENGWDCGMYMLKYADFYSRDLSLCFAQDHMRYFRMRTAKEILRLRAE